MDIQLLKAAGAGKAHIVEKLCSKGAEVDGISQTTSPIHMAARYGHVEVLHVLCRHGADVNRRISFGRTPLQEASLHGHVAVSRQLCEQGADVNAGDFNGYRPIHNCALTGHKDTMSCLCDAGANMGLTTNFGCTALHIAAEGNDPDIVERLCALGANVNYENKLGNTAMHVVTHPKSVEVLWKHGANINKLTKLGTPLYLAAKHGHADVIEALCSLGTDISLSKDSPVSAILDLIRKLVFWPSQTAHLEKLCRAMMLLLLAGFHPAPSDITLMKYLQLPALREALEYSSRSSNPSSLDHICKLAIRRWTQKPLTQHVPQLGLPTSVQSYLLLEY